MSGEKPVRVVSILQEFSIPLLVGAAVALLVANLANDGYQAVLHWMPFGPVSLIGHEVTLHFLVNDVFMVFFFAIAAKEITEGCLPGGSLNPIRKAINPLMATVGGVVAPALVFFLGLWLLFESGVYDPEVDDWFLLARGWGVPTATDIALAWLVARTIFGRGHPAVNFLLLLAVADDAIGLVIIAAPTDLGRATHRRERRAHRRSHPTATTRPQNYQDRRVGERPISHWHSPSAVSECRHRSQRTGPCQWGFGH